MSERVQLPIGEESWAEQVTRLRLMAKGDPKWDLSPNDQAAIAAALNNLRAACLERCPDETNGTPCAWCPYRTQADREP